jgi:hypothetical protein
VRDDHQRLPRQQTRPKSPWQRVAPLGLYVSLIELGLVMTPHFTADRLRATAGMDLHSAYHAWFVQHGVDAVNALAY